MTHQQTLRRHLRQARLALPADEAGKAQARALHRLRHHPWFRRAKRVAAYVGNNGELDPMPLLADAVRLHKSVYLPVLHPFKVGRLWFCRWRPGDRLVNNRFGILEPVRRRDHLLPARRLDLVIVPLLGFDARCHRIGMGGGFYDRTFAFVKHGRHIRGPRLLGLAHDVQRVDALQPQPWDVQLDAVVTPQQIFCAES